MLVEIWSDIVCPFCYIGKKRFRQALKNFAHRDQVEVVWKSFQLNPELKSRPGQSIGEYLSEMKGWSIDQVREVNAHVANMGRSSGIEFNFDKVVVANSFDAHRVLHFAASEGRSNEMTARLFRAYFNEGRDIADRSVLAAMAADAGLDSSETRDMLNSDRFASAVGRDIFEARKLGIRGVPCFYFNRTRVISGAQDASVFLNALNDAWDAIPRTQSIREPLDGSVCDGESDC